MPINPSVALQVEPPKPLDIAGAFQKAANLRSMANQETIQKQAIEQNAQAIRDQQLVRKAWIEANGKDEDFLTRIKTAGVSPDTFQRYEAAYQERRGKMAATNADELKAQQLRWGNLRSLFLTVLDEKDETKSKALMNRSFEMAKARKLITDEELKRIQSIMDKGWNREDAQMYINSLSSDVNLSKEIEREQKAQINMLKAQNYAANIASQIDARKIKSKVDVENALTRAKQLQENISRNADMSDYRWAALKQEQDQYVNTLIERKRQFDTREANLNTRQDKTIAAAQERATMVQDRMDARQQVAIEKGFSPTQIAQATHYAIRDMGYESLEDIDEDTVEEFNSLVDSYLNRQSPKFGTKPGGMLGLGTSPTVTPGAEVNPRNTRSATPAAPRPESAKTTTQTPIPQEFIDKMPVGKAMKITDPTGAVSYWIKDLKGKVTKTTAPVKGK